MPIDERELNRAGGFRLPTPVAPLCPRCQYNLTGLRDARCPECGHEFQWQTVRRKARAQWLEALGLKTLPEEIEFGFRLAMAAWALAIVLRLGVGLIGPAASCALDVLFLLMYATEVFLAFCAAFLCSHVIKFRRLPVEAREALRIEVPVAKAWAGLGSSVVLLIVSAPTCISAL